MQATGMICAVLDTDADSIEAFNRWYDLEHLPPNISMAGVMSGRRYVATPELHRLRIADPTSPLAGGRGTFLTAYTLCQPAGETVGRMSTLRDELYATDRMQFPADKKVVRDGGALELISAVPSPDIALVPIDVPFVGHTGALLIRRNGSVDVATWYREDWSRRVAALDGVHGVVSLGFLGSDGEELDIIYFEGEPSQQTEAIRAAAPHHREVTLVADAPFALIAPLQYPWIDDIVNSDLPKTIG